MTGICFTRSRTSPIVSVHRELGAEFFIWNQMLTSKSYGNGVSCEHLAIRQSAGLTDMSGIKKGMGWRFGCSRSPRFCYH